MNSSGLVENVEAVVMRALREEARSTSAAHTMRAALWDVLMRIERDLHGVHHYCINDMLASKGLTESRYVAAPEVDDFYDARDQHEFLEASG